MRYCITVCLSLFFIYYYEEKKKNNFIKQHIARENYLNWAHLVEKRTKISDVVR